MEQQQKKEEDDRSESDAYWDPESDEESEDNDSEDDESSKIQPKNFRTCLICHKSGHTGPKCFRLKKIKKPEERRKYLSDNQVST